LKSNKNEERKRRKEWTVKHSRAREYRVAAKTRTRLRETYPKHPPTPQDKDHLKRKNPKTQRSRIEPGAPTGGSWQGSLPPTHKSHTQLQRQRLRQGKGKKARIEKDQSPTVLNAVS